MPADRLQLIRAVFERHLALYCERDGRFAACFSPDFSGLTPDGENYVRERDAWLEALLDDYAQVPGPLGMQVLDWHAQDIAPGLCLVTALCRVQRTQHGQGVVAGPLLRWVQVLRLEDGDWKILHHSASVPTAGSGGGPVGAGAPRHAWLQWLQWPRWSQKDLSGRSSADTGPNTADSALTPHPPDASAAWAELAALQARYSALQTQHAATVQALAYAQDSLQKAHHTDTLTGLANHQGFDETLIALWSQAQRNATPIALVILQLADWPAYRQHYGQLAADRCLQTVAQALQTLAPTPPPATLARLADDRFALLLPNTTADQAAPIAQQWQTAVLALGIAHDGTPGKLLHAAVGFTAMQPGRVDAPAVLVRAADVALRV